LEPEVTPEVEIPDMEDFQILLRRRLDTARKRLVTADEGHLKALRRLKVLRRARDLAVGELRRLLARLRQAVEGVHGPGAAAEVLLLEGPTPRDPVVLQRTAARTLEHLEQTGLPTPPAPLAEIDLGADLWVDLIREPLQSLGDSLSSLALEKRDAVDTLLAKNAAQKDYDRLYASTTRMLQEFFRYVGMDEMADTIRPPRRKVSSGPEEAAEDPENESPVAARDAVGAGLVSARVASDDEAASGIQPEATTRVAPSEEGSIADASSPHYVDWPPAVRAGLVSARVAAGAGPVPAPAQIRTRGAPAQRPPES